MTDWGRYAARVAVRRVVYLVIAAVIGWLSIGTSHAANYPDQGAAYQGCVAQGQSQLNATWTSYSCTRLGTSAYYICSLAMASGGTNNCTESNHYWPAGQECTARSIEDQWQHDGDPNTVDAVCHNGCLYDSALFIDGATTFTYYQAAGGVCKVGDAPPPEPCTNTACVPDRDGDGIPDSQDDFPDDPDHSSDKDGDGIPDEEDAAPEDPDNGEDDGEGDESDNKAEGGGTCASPPSCIGDGILCNTLFQNWKTRCAIEGALTGDGSIRVELPEGGTPGGGGDSLDETNSLLEALGTKLGEIETWLTGEGDENQIGDYLGDGSGEPGAGTGVTIVPSELPDELDQSGFGWGQTCPTIPSVDVMGTTLDFNTTVFCDWMTLGGWFVMLLAGLASLRIMSQV